MTTRSIPRLLLVLLIGLLAFTGAAPGFLGRAQAEVTAAARVDRTRITMNDALNLVVTIEGGEGEVDVSPIRDFQVQSRGTGTSVSIINGRVSRTMRHEFALYPQKAGALRIPPLPVHVDGRTVTTREISIQVGGAPAVEDSPAGVFLQVSVSKPDPFVGEQILFTLKVIRTVRVANAQLAALEFQGLTSRRLPNPREYTTVIDGRPAAVTELLFVLTPVEPGDLKIDPVELHCDVVRADPNRRRTLRDEFFDDPFFSRGRLERKTYRSPALALKVRELPPYEGRIPFSGLVGDFEFSTGIEKRSLAVGDSTTLTVTVKGRGNIMDFGAPEIVPPAGVKLYQDAPEEEINLDEKGYSGHRTFRFALAPFEPGEKSLPPLGLAFFNPEREQYVVIESEPISFHVERAETPEQTVVSTPRPQAPAETNRKQKVEFLHKDVLPLKEDLAALKDQGPLSGMMYFLGVLIPGLLFAAARAARGFIQREQDVSSRMARKARTILRSMDTGSPESGEVWSRCARALVAAICARSGRESETLTYDEAESMLREARVSAAEAAEILEIMKRLDACQYGGFRRGKRRWRGPGEGNPPGGPEAVPMRRWMKSGFPAAGSWRMVIILPLLLAILLAGPAHPARASDMTRLFLDGLKDAEEGRYQEAADKFESIARSGAANGRLYYNLGGVYLKKGDLGRAILWYERAVRLMPADPDLKFNLAYARSLVKDEPAPGESVLIRVAFFWKNFLPPRTIQWSALAANAMMWLSFGILIFYRRRLFRIVGVGALVLNLLFTPTAVYQVYNRHYVKQAVVLPAEIEVRSGRSGEATAMFLLHAGTKVRIDDEQDGYVRVRFVKDKVGWVERTVLGII